MKWSKILRIIKEELTTSQEAPRMDKDFQVKPSVSSSSLSKADEELRRRIERAIIEAGGDQQVLRQKMREIGKDATAAQTYMVIIPTLYNNLPEIKQKLAGLTAVYQLNIEGAGQWHLIFTNGELEVKEGAHPTPNVTITMTEEVRKATAEGKLDPQMAFMSGKIKFAGDMALLMKLGALIRG